ncbi:unnamed protein product [Didymodactylos carnosus]|uniref:Protein-tyrosine-phosphatase n=1 Tax=Didymodactylos carnosus TaxID=1234261 RepID=A0A813RVN9_9BILA|nr:unnamed protein product [Didymodactylos carnosus]CAF0847340.1 unnamed protein product [Didymodactylos carnosus]CAF3571478.1 unnamed protein product [Didymodactylos carnosus]CAF3632573.1 unnamed protein product [Didymodactylos carnosus]
MAQSSSSSSTTTPRNSIWKKTACSINFNVNITRRTLSESDELTTTETTSSHNNQPPRKRQLSDSNEQTNVKVVKINNDWSRPISVSKCPNETDDSLSTFTRPTSLFLWDTKHPLQLRTSVSHPSDNRCEINDEINLKFSPCTSLPELSSPVQQQKRHRPRTLLVTNPALSSSCETSLVPLINIVQDKIGLLTCEQLALYVESSTDERYLILDCGSPFRFHEKHIKNSQLMYVSDKITRKRFATRGIQSFVNTKLLDKCELIILYDDTLQKSHIIPNSCPVISDEKCLSFSSSFFSPTITLSTANDDNLTTIKNIEISLHRLTPSLKCVCEEIKRYNYNKKIYILNPSFSQFYEQYKHLCECSPRQQKPRSCPSSPVHNSYCESVPLTAPLSITPVSPTQKDYENFPMTEIVNGLYIGSKQDAQNIQRLENEQITHIINVTQHLPCYWKNSSDLIYYHLPADDSNKQNLIDYFDKVYNFILDAIENNKKVLVHCQAGISRSPAIVIGFLMKYSNMSMNDAYDLVKRKRSIVSPNFGFLGQLLEYEKKLKQYQTSPIIEK